jgi:microcystin-dependent protein
MKQFTAGETGGNEKVLLTVDNLPKHNHTVTISGKPKCATAEGTEDMPAGNYPAKVSGSPNAYSTTPVDTANLAATVLPVSTPVAFGQNQEVINILSPFLIMNYIICIEGIYPSRG